VRYYHQDHHGSTRALTNQTGAIVAKYTYDAYGNPTSPPTSVENPFGYDGQQTDPETGLQYLRARHYDPTTAQFLTRDPIADQTRTPYTYANNNPTNHSDPTGLLPDLTPQFVDDGAGYLADGAEAVGQGAVTIGEYGWEHRRAVAAVGLGGVCTLATAGTCAAWGGIVFAGATLENGYNELQDSCNEFWRNQVVDTASTLAGAIPSARLASPGVTALLPRSRLGQRALNGSQSLPGTILGTVQD
jgi:RHS repeat-associated protein